MKNILGRLLITALVITGCVKNTDREAASRLNFIEVCKENPSWFQFSDGTPFIPIGINMINPSGRFRDNPDSAMYEMEQWMKNLSENGGNYVRIWLSQSFWDMEDGKAGVYNEEKLKRIDWFIATARKYNLRIKMTLEHFRSLTLEENPQRWAMKSIYHTSQGGPLDSIRQYITTPEGHTLFLDKIDFYQKRYGSDTLFFGWELWNEMNAVKGPEDSLFFAWNEKMLKEVKLRFPENLVMQSFGSFDNERGRPDYKKMVLLPDNEVAQIHRYLDLGAEMEICQAPMDMICSSAIEELRSYHSAKPLILAETGAVEPRHSGPSKYYVVDTAGILLHDLLFAPFFAGSAGTGMSWHWDSYVGKNNLWYHFGRFYDVIKGIDPIRENMIPLKSETDDLRVYVLKGNNTTLVWLRDKNSHWKTELDEGKLPALLSGLKIRPSDSGFNAEGSIQLYDPWEPGWKPGKFSGDEIELPDFKRSLILKISR